MALSRFEEEILREVMEVTGREGLKEKHLRQWSSVKGQVVNNMNGDEEDYIFVESMGIHTAILKGK